MDRQGQSWCSQLAANLVLNVAPTQEVIQRLQDLFLDNQVTELWIVLASGSRQASKPESLDCHTLISNGIINEQPLTPKQCLQPNNTSAATISMQKDQSIVITSSDPDASTLSDWKLMSETSSTPLTFLLASCICCKNAVCNGMLGAVLVGGIGETPPIGLSWLDEFSTELGHAVAHASIAVLEQSLDMLSVIFPPNMVEMLVSNAVSSVGSVITDGMPPPPTMVDANETSAHYHQQHQNYQPQYSPIPPDRNSSDSDSRMSLTDRSPFAALARTGTIATGTTVTAPSSRSPSNVLAVSPRSSSESRSPTSTMGAIDNNRRASSLAGSSPQMSAAMTALSVLRQASLASDASLLFTEAPTSPANSEILGYEDILADDALQCAVTRAEHSLTNHVSIETPPSTTFKEAVDSTVQYTDISTSSLLRSFTPPADSSTSGVFNKKDTEETFLGQHTTEKDTEMYPSSTTLAAYTPEATIIAGTTKAIEAMEHHYPPHHHQLDADHRLTPIQESSSLSSRLSIYSLYQPATSSGSLQGSLSSPQRLWNITGGLDFGSQMYMDPEEQRFAVWQRYRLLKQDKVLGAILVGILVAVLLSADYVSTELVVEFVCSVIPIAAAVFLPGVWLKRRGEVVAVSRLFSVVSSAYFQYYRTKPVLIDDAVAPSSVQSSWQAVWLASHSVCFQLTLPLHLIVQLLCLWTLTAAGQQVGVNLNVTSTGDQSQSGGMSVEGAVLVQLMVGLVLPTLVVAVMELKRRREFAKRQRV